MRIKLFNPLYSGVFSRLSSYVPKGTRLHMLQSVCQTMALLILVSHCVHFFCFALYRSLAYFLLVRFALSNAVFWCL
jgi:hypothetical protein